MSDETLPRLEAKLDRLQAAIERLERKLEHRPVRRPLIVDPELRNRLRQRVRRLEESGELAEYRRRIAEEDARRGDPDWWLREMLDRADRED